MQTLTIMDMVAIGDYYHVTTMNEDMNWMKLTHHLSNFPLDLRAPVCTFTSASKFSIAF